ncbi:delta(24)-sterol reductase-like [Senna tora]|uniref:Delta(24)-sterol reductase-like n=1 Tax=Senna tora TaxID=362788 RepID=A0A834TNN0_9FABA|nr:delta(24)-sterol reductase-like [Senna tora]
MPLKDMEAEKWNMGTPNNGEIVVVWRYLCARTAEPQLKFLAYSRSANNGQVEWAQWKAKLMVAFGEMKWLFEHQASATLLIMTEAYLAICDSGDCCNLPTTGNKGDERRNCLQGECAHILAKEKRAIFKGESLAESFLLGFNAITEQSDISFRRACKR